MKRRQLMKSVHRSRRRPFLPAFLFLLFAMIAVSWTRLLSKLSNSTIFEEVGHSVHVPGKRQHYPTWGQNNTGFELEPLLQKMDETLQRKVRFPFHTVHVYIIDNREGKPTLWTSKTIRGFYKKIFIRNRVNQAESLFVDALDYLARNDNDKWPALRRALQQGDGFPFLVYYWDFVGCAFHEYDFGIKETKQQEGPPFSTPTVPLFTLSATVSCNYSFPFPTYKTINYSKQNASVWQSLQQEYAKQYPWESKQPKAVWRGTLTGWEHLREKPNNRKRLCEIGGNHTDVLDIDTVTEYKDGKGAFVGMDDMQRYRAIIDIDGNSWSARFGKLLCSNSVILKVRPQYVEHFYPTLQPWKHFIPIKLDLSDLVEKSRFAVSDENQDTVKKIIANAQEWCVEHMTKEAIAKDMLDIWNGYVEELDKGDQNWQQEWRRKKQEFFTPRYNMARFHATGQVVPFAQVSTEPRASEWASLELIDSPI